MKICVQRIKKGKVTLIESGDITGQIGFGILILLGIKTGDNSKNAHFLAEKAANLRIFEDAEGKMNKSLIDVGGEALVVSQFTLYGNCHKGRRPSFVEAARPEIAQPLYLEFVQVLKNEGIRVQTGAFQQEMDVEFINSGPVTLILES